MPTSITRSVVRKQLCAMGCELFEIGVLHQNALMLLRCGWSAAQIDAALGWLRRENARGAHIFVRPNGVHALSMLDDLGVDGIAQMTDAGFQPAVVVETSPQNFQVWLNHGRTLDHKMSGWAAKELAKRFGGDPSSADWRHFGRLAGFTNRKPERVLSNGLGPFVRLHQCEAKIYDAAPVFLEVVKYQADNAAAERPNWTTFRTTSNGNPIQSLADFHRSARYAGDMHRADMAWAIHAARRSLSEEQIIHEILHARDLSKKGRIERQITYAKRTANKALRAASRLTESALAFR